MNCSKPPPPPPGNGGPPPENDKGPPPKNDGPPPNHEERKKQWEADRKAYCPEERVACYKTSNTTPDQMMAFSMMCDSECQKCLQNKFEAHRNGTQAAGHERPEPTPEQKAHWGKRMNQTMDCMVKAIGM